MATLLPTLLRFGVVCAAASMGAELLQKLRLPLVSGYLLAGILVGPHCLGLLGAPDCSRLAALVTDDSMGFIGFAAGSKFGDVVWRCSATIIFLRWRLR